MDLMDKYLLRVKPEGREIELSGRKETTNTEMQQMMAEGAEDATYTFEEVSQMIDGGVSKEGLVAIHKIKKVFAGSSIENIVDEDRN